MPHLWEVVAVIDAMLNLLFGCRHRRMTRPITAVHKPGTPSGGSYVTCLECGKRFPYDVTNMCIAATLPSSWSREASLTATRKAS